MEGLEEVPLLHTQEVRGSSPCAPTISATFGHSPSWRSLDLNRSQFLIVSPALLFTVCHDDACFFRQSKRSLANCAADHSTSPPRVQFFVSIGKIPLALQDN